MDKSISGTILLLILILLVMSFIVIAPVGIAIYQTWDAGFTKVIVYGVTLTMTFLSFMIAVTITTLIGFAVYRRVKHSEQYEREHNWFVTQSMRNQNMLPQGPQQSDPIFAPPIDTPEQFDLIEDDQWLNS